MTLYAQIDLALPRELGSRGITWQQRAVYIEAVLYARENLRDGVILRNELPFWMPDLAAKTRASALDAMRDRGALIDHPDGWMFPAKVWQKWNPSKADVEAQRAAAAERKAAWRARRTGNVPPVSQDCPTGTETSARVTATRASGRVPDSHSHSHSHSQSQSKSHSHSHLSSTGSLSQRRPLRDEEDGGIGMVSKAIGAHLAERAKARSPKAYAAKCATDAANEHGPEIARLCRKFPTASASQVAAFVLGEKSALNYCPPDDEAA